MKIPKYWAQGQSLSSSRQNAFSCWHWSDTSVEDAKHKAEARASELAGKLATGVPLDRYGYGDRPMREQVIQKIAEGGNESAIVTRNLYGALVLNAAQAMFIDVDFDSCKPPRQGGLLGRLFGKRPAGPSPQDLTLAQVQAWAQSHRDLGVRVYRTAAGLRCLITNQLFDPTATETVELLRQAGSDPLYVRLCHAQSCFRARLTPKPWRCGASTPPVRYPWSGSDQEALFCRWQAEYEQAAGNYSVCRLVGQTGPSVVHPDIQPLVSLHDRFTCGPVERELA